MINRTLCKEVFPELPRKAWLWSRAKEMDLETAFAPEKENKFPPFLTFISKLIFNLWSATQLCHCCSFAPWVSFLAEEMCIYWATIWGNPVLKCSPYSLRLCSVTGSDIILCFSSSPPCLMIWADSRILGKKYVCLVLTLS